MKKVVIFGSNGLLGQSLVKRFSKHFDIIAASKKVTCSASEVLNYHQIDLADRSQTTNFLIVEKPDIIINAAAYTDVDGCESEKEACWNTNVRGVENIIEAAESFKPILVQISTDYVFDGYKGWYTELEKPDPKGNYARSKYAAENIVSSSPLEYIIARTQVLYGLGNKINLNFVTWVVHRLSNNKKIRVVFDQIGNPTYTEDLSESIYRLLDKKEYGLFHIAGSEVINRYEFALKIAEVFELDSALIEKISTSELKQSSPRPLNSSFVIDKLVNRIGWQPGDVNSGLKRLKIMMNKKNG